MRIVTLCALAACAPASPFQGPGFDGELITDAPGPFQAVATHTRAKSGSVGAFGDAVAAVEEQLDTQPGFIGSSLRARMPGRERWTLTVWEDEESLLAFVTSGAHLEAMVDQAELIDGVYSARWVVEPGELPLDWSDVLHQLEQVAPADPWE
jgi:heme-degrading monooxygenase HmoA